MKCSIMAGNLRRMVESGTVKYGECRKGCDVVLYLTLSAGHHFVCHLPGSGKDWAQNRCMGGAVNLMKQLITDSLIKYYCEVLHNAPVKIHESMQIEDRYKHFRDTVGQETIHWARARLIWSSACALYGGQFLSLAQETLHLPEQAPVCHFQVHL